MPGAYSITVIQVCAITYVRPFLSEVDFQVPGSCYCSDLELCIRIYISIFIFIYLSGRLSFANGIDATHKEELYLRRVLN